MARQETRAPGTETATGPGDRREEFGQRFRECSRVLWLIAAGVVRNPVLADDVVQEAVMVALNKLDQFEKGTNFAAWMGSIVRFVALNLARRERRRRSSYVDLADLGVAQRADAGSGPANASRSNRPEGPIVSGPLFDDNIQRALDSVSDIARTCLLLRTVEELPYSEIAALLEIPEGTAMSHVHRARRDLREQLKRSQPMNSTDAGLID